MGLDELFEIIFPNFLDESDKSWVENLERVYLADKTLRELWMERLEEILNHLDLSHIRLNRIAIFSFKMFCFRLIASKHVIKSLQHLLRLLVPIFHACRFLVGTVLLGNHLYILTGLRMFLLHLDLDLMRLSLKSFSLFRTWYNLLYWAFSRICSHKFFMLCGGFILQDSLNFIVLYWLHVEISGICLPSYHLQQVFTILQEVGVLEWDVLGWALTFSKVIHIKLAYERI